jgi:putative FmdB family regulatory protein
MYDYQCRHCNRFFEELVFSSSVADEKIKCPYCGHLDAQRQLSAPAVAVGDSFEPACQKPSCATPADSAYT